jgi:hypothetical protein
MPILSFSETNIDADALDFINVAVITDSTQQSAINTLVLGLKNFGLWTKMKAIYPFIGGLASSHKWNLKDARDLDAAYRLYFYGGIVHNSNGILTDGLSAYADTFLNPSTVFADFKNNSHLSVYTKIQNPTGSGWDIGVGNSSTGDPLFALAIKRPTWSTYTNPIIYDFGNYSGNGRLITTYNDARGFWIGSTTSSNSHVLYRNGVSLVTSSNIASGSITNLTMNIGRLNTTSTPYYYLDNQYAFATIGDGLTVTEAGNLYTLVQEYQTTLGRQA